MVTVYVIESLKDQTWYTGMALNAEKRLNERNEVNEIIAGLVYTTIYKREIDGGSAAKITTSGKPFTAASETDGSNNITVYYKKRMNGDDGTKQLLMEDYFNAASALSHEEDHERGMDENGFSHFKIGAKEAQNKFQSKVNKYYKENLIINMGKYLRDQVSSILQFEQKGDTAEKYRKDYEDSLFYGQKLSIICFRIPN